MHRPASPRPLGHRARFAPPLTGAGQRPARSERPTEIRRVLIDGRNVQGAFGRGSAAGAMPTSTLISSLRAAFAPPSEVELILDGHRGGGPSGRISPGFTVHFTRDASADQVIGDRVAGALRELGPADAWSVVVVSDDREVGAHARRHGARVEGTAWLAARLARPAERGAALGHGRPPRSTDVG